MHQVCHDLFFDVGQRCYLGGNSSVESDQVQTKRTADWAYPFAFLKQIYLPNELGTEGGRDLSDICLLYTSDAADE